MATWTRDEVLNCYAEFFKPTFKFNLKPEQETLITGVCNRQDAFGVLPTGYGKSMVYTLAPLILDKVNFEK